MYIVKICGKLVTSMSHFAFFGFYWLIYLLVARRVGRLAPKAQTVIPFKIEVDTLQKIFGFPNTRKIYLQSFRSCIVKKYTTIFGFTSYNTISVLFSCIRCQPQQSDVFMQMANIIADRLRIPWFGGAGAIQVTFTLLY